MPARRINRESWPQAGPHRRLLEFLDKIHLEQGCKSFKDVAEGSQLSKPRVYALLRALDATVPTGRAQVKDLVRGLGGGLDEQRRAVALYDKMSASPPQAPAKPGQLVRDTDPRIVGIHPAIVVDGFPSRQPKYVQRDIDQSPNGLRAQLAGLAEHGGLLILIGGSSVGKTRSAWEAVVTLFPDWRLARPTDAPALATIADQPPTTRTIVWLDEFQRYLSHPAMTAGVVQSLLTAPTPIVMVGTMWSEWHGLHTVLPTVGEAEAVSRGRQILDLATTLWVDGQFSRQEQSRAQIIAAHDPQIRAALAVAEYGVTQAVAAAPQLMARFRDGAPLATAVMTAAVDAVRLGVRSPLSAELLRAAAPGYCDVRTRATADPTWLEQALDYATELFRGASAVLNPVGNGMGTIEGYTVADYVRQKVSRDRRTQRVPAEAWNAFLVHVPDTADIERLGISADHRALYGYAISAFRRAVGPRDILAARRLAELLARCGDLDELRSLADGGNRYADEQVAKLLVHRGAIEELRERADAHGPLTGTPAQCELATLLAQAGDVEELQKRADAGNNAARHELAAILVERDVDQLTARTESGDTAAAQELIGLLTAQGRAQEAVEIIRPQADLDPLPMPNSWWGLFLLMVEGRIDELRAACNRAVAPWAGPMLAKALSSRGLLSELRGLADSGNGAAALSLANLLDQLGHSDELRSRADQGDEYAARALADREAQSFAANDDLDGLRALAPTNWQAAVALVDLLAVRGDVQALKDMADEGSGTAAAKAAELLAAAGDEAGLWDSLDRGHEFAAERLADVLIASGRAAEGNRLRCFGLLPDGSIADNCGSR